MTLDLWINYISILRIDIVCISSRASVLKLKEKYSESIKPWAHTHAYICVHTSPILHNRSQDFNEKDAVQDYNSNKTPEITHFYIYTYI
jgi:hypothetical protein